MMIEYEDVEERRRMLAQLVGIENRVWVKAAGFERVLAIADEDLERSTEQKTSAVHFLRFELTSGMVSSLKQGTALSMGVDHPAYQAILGPISRAISESLLHDLKD